MSFYRSASSRLGRIEAKLSCRSFATGNHPPAAPRSIVTPAAKDLHAQCQHELKEEIKRDDLEGVIPPLVPPGWTVRHSPGTRVMEMHRTLTSAQLAAASRRFRSKFFAEAEMRDRIAASATTKVPVYLVLRAAFETLEPCFYDPDVEIVEWVPFDVFVGKPGCHECMFLQMASVNSELRIRYVQFVPNPLLGGGSTHVLQSSVGSTNDWRKVGSPDSRGRTGMVNLPPSFWGEAAVYDREGVRYRGPNVNKLSKELYSEMFEFIYEDLAIDGRLAEFVCQMLYFTENEEYERWLGRLAHFVMPPQ